MLRLDSQFNSPDENALIIAASSGDTVAFERIVELYEKLVYNTIKLKIKNSEDAFDLSQEVFIKIWRSIGSYRGDCKFSSWVYKIATNTTLDHLRREAHTKSESLPTHIDDDGEEKVVEIADESTYSSPERTLERNETVITVREAIEQLKPEQREVILLRDIEGYSYEAISEMLELEIGTVKSRINRARGSLKTILEELGVGL